MSAIPQQVLNSQKAAIDAFVAVQGSFYSGFEKLVDLNLKALKATIDEVSATSQQVVGVKDAQELMAMQAGLMQPLAEKTAAYSRHLYDIATSTGAQFGKAMEDKSVEAQKTFSNLIDSAAKNAPAGSETAVSMVKSAVAASQNAMESMQKVDKQSTEIAEANFNAVTASAVTAAKTASKKR